MQTSSLFRPRRFRGSNEMRKEIPRKTKKIGKPVMFCIEQRAKRQQTHFKRQAPLFSQTYWQGPFTGKNPGFLIRFSLRIDGHQLQNKGWQTRWQPKTKRNKKSERWNRYFTITQLHAQMSERAVRPFQPWSLQYSQLLPVFTSRLRVIAQ